MKKMVKVLCAAVFGAAVLAGCSTFAPLQGNNVSVTQNATVLGRVTVDAKSDKSGFTLLMDEAKKQYPDADDIVNILVDARKSFFGGTYYRMSAVVVKYK